MLFRLTARSLALLLALGGAPSSAGAQLRGGRRRAALFPPRAADPDAGAASTTHAGPPSAPSASSGLRGGRASALARSSHDAVGDARAGAFEAADSERPEGASVSAGDEAEGDEDPAAAVASSAFAAAPALGLDKSIYVEGDPIAVSLSVGAPSHPYWASGDAPSRTVDRSDYAAWSVGLFMRDADPQGGDLAPLVRVGLCAAFEDGCDAADPSNESFDGLTVRFGSEWRYQMDGLWPLEVSEYGTGFDAFVLDGNGAAAIGPLSFEIHIADEEAGGGPGGNGPATYRYDLAPAPDGGGVKSGATVAEHPLLKYRKGTTRATGRHHGAVSVAAATAARANDRLESANDVEAAPRGGVPVDVEGATAGDASVGTAGDGHAATPAAEDAVAADKEEYEADEAVVLRYSLPATADPSSRRYRIGIFMRMAHPQGGTLAPAASLPLCPEDAGEGGCARSGTVTFGPDTADIVRGEGGGWPLDPLAWGTGFDAYVLDERGEEVAGPARFNVLMDDTY